MNSDDSDSLFLGPNIGPPEEWVLLRNAVKAPVQEIIAVEVESDAQAQNVISALKALGPASRIIIEQSFDPRSGEESPESLLSHCQAKINGHANPEILPLAILKERWKTQTDDDGAKPFWSVMNQLRENWHALPVQHVWLLSPGSWRGLSEQASHLKRWINVKIHLKNPSDPQLSDRTHMDSPADSFSILPTQAKTLLATLEEQLLTSQDRQESEALKIKRYYLPMLRASLAIGDLKRARLLSDRITEFDTNLDFEALSLLVESSFREHNLVEADHWAQHLLKTIQNDENGNRAAITYHQLGMIAQEQRDYAKAEEWYLKSLRIEETQGNDYGAASTYHQMGIIAEEQRDYVKAEEWYIKSLAITEKQGNEHYAASTYHQLGNIAEEQRDYVKAEEWYVKSLDIKEKQGNEHGAASTYHNLGNIAQEQRDYAKAEEWYVKSLDIKEKQGNEHGAAMTYHQLGNIAEEQQDYVKAEEWYIKSLAITEKQGNAHYAACTYHQLGKLAEEHRDYVKAEEWYIKALRIWEKQGSEHGAANTYGQLGILVGTQKHFVASAQWLVKSIVGFAGTEDERLAGFGEDNFRISFKAAGSEERVEMQRIWQEAGLPELDIEGWVGGEG